MFTIKKLGFTQIDMMSRAVVRVLLSCAVLAAAAAAPANPALQERAHQASDAASPQICPPDGFVAPERREIKNGEFQYCTALSDNVLMRRDCVKWVPAAEYVKFKSGRSDAVYSGMALHRESLLLFYCLPKKK